MGRRAIFGWGLVHTSRLKPTRVDRFQCVNWALIERPNPKLRPATPPFARRRCRCGSKRGGGEKGPRGNRRRASERHRSSDRPLARPSAFPPIACTGPPPPPPVDRDRSLCVRYGRGLWRVGLGWLGRWFVCGFSGMREGQRLAQRLTCVCSSRRRCDGMQRTCVVLCVCVRLTPGRCRGGDLADRLEKAAQQVKTAYSECPSYDVVRWGV